MNRRDAGFTLIEMVVVLVILALSLTLLLSRGPARSAALDARAAAALVAGTLRGARAEAIAQNRTVSVVFDPAGSRFGVPGGRTQALPPELSLSAAPATIGFAPDGSSTGGAVRLDGKGRRITVEVSWLTGRVALAEAGTEAGR